MKLKLTAIRMNTAAVVDSLKCSVVSVLKTMMVSKIKLHTRNNRNNIGIKISLTSVKNDDVFIYIKNCNIRSCIFLCKMNHVQTYLDFDVALYPYIQ